MVSLKSTSLSLYCDPESPRTNSNATSTLHLRFDAIFKCPRLIKKTTTKSKLFTGSLNQNPVKMEAKWFPCYARGCTKQFDCFKPLYKPIFWGCLQCPDPQPRAHNRMSSFLDNRSRRVNWLQCVWYGHIKGHIKKCSLKKRGMHKCMTHNTNKTNVI